MVQIFEKNIQKNFALVQKVNYLIAAVCDFYSTENVPVANGNIYVVGGTIGIYKKVY